MLKQRYIHADAIDMANTGKTSVVAEEATYTDQQRLDALADLASSVEIMAVLCLDGSFVPVELPQELEELGLGGIGPGMFEDRYLQSVDSRDHGVIATQISVAHSRGIGGGRIRLSEASGHQGVDVAVQIFDFRERNGVTLFVVGDFEPRWGGVLMAAAAPLPVRMLRHKCNEMGHYTVVDPRTERVLGWSPSDLLGADGPDLIHEDDRNRALQAWLQVLAGGEGSRQRCRHLTKEGNWRWLELTYTNYLNTHDGGYIEIQALDVEDEMEALAQARIGASQFETLARTLPVGVVQLDAFGSLVFANEWVRKKTQVDEAERPDALLEAVHPDDRAVLHAAIAQCLAGEEVSLELRLKNFRTQELRLCRVRSRPLIVDGEIFGVMASMEDITETVSLHDQLRAQAATDHLTGLPNRTAVTQRLQELIADSGRSNPAFACLFLDLDGFKLVNDGLGHHAGDQLLTSISERLRTAVRPSDLVARVGGDEFLVVCEWTSNQDDLIKLAQRLMVVVQRPVLINGVSANVGVSVGIALHDGQEATADVVISNADLAMYEAKRSGGARWAIFGDEMRDSMHQRFDLQRSLHEAINNGEFRMHLQPIWDLVTGDVVGAEGLVRWEHPTKGMISPGYFIPFAAESELMIPLGWWIINDCCRIAAEVVASGSPGFKISINAAGSQLSEPGFADKLLATIAAHGLQPSNVVLEITETVWIDDGQSVNQALCDLNEAGTTIALDDFGTGYSSLNHLREMPVSWLKIDSSYVREVVTCSATRSIVEVIQDLAGKLGLDIVVEGIETTEQRDLLCQMGFRLAQGYLLARPCDEETFLSTYAPLVARPARQLTD